MHIFLTSIHGCYEKKMVLARNYGNNTCSCYGSFPDSVFCVDMCPTVATMLWVSHCHFLYRAIVSMKTILLQIAWLSLRKVSDKDPYISVSNSRTMLPQNPRFTVCPIRDKYSI